MEFSNFELIKTEGNNSLNLVFFAFVDVTTKSGILWWKKQTTIRRKIRRPYGGFWFFIDNGEFTPGHEIDNLERAFMA